MVYEMGPDSMKPPYLFVEPVLFQLLNQY